MEFFTKINSKYSVLEEQEAKEKIILESQEFLEILKDYLYKMRLEKANLVGLGNSLTAGWSAIHPDVRPFVLKLKELLKEELAKSGIPLEFYNYSLASDNSNKKIFYFLVSHPTESDVKKRFIEDKRKWDQKFAHTPFQNYIDLEKAQNFYPESEKELMSCYRYNELTISLLNCFTGRIFSIKENGQSILDILDEEEENFRKIIDFLKYLKIRQDQNIITVGNVPFISTSLGYFTNGFVHYLNNRIESICAAKNVSFFEENQVALLQKFQDPITGKEIVKFDNHPSMEEQYTILYKYMKYLENILKEYSSTRSLKQK